MTKPVILAVDDDREVLARDRARPAHAVPRATTAIVVGASGRRGARGRAAAEAPRRRHRAVPRRPAHAGDDAAPSSCARRASSIPDAMRGAAHRLRRHRRGDRRHQRGRAPSLPDEAVGSARGAALPGARRPARGVGGAGARRRSRAFASRARAGRRRATTAREFLSRNQVPYQWIDIDQDAPTRELVVVDRRRRSRGCRSCCFPTAAHLVAPTNAELAREGRAADAGDAAVLRRGDHRRRARRGWRTPSTPRRKGCTCC